MWDIKMLCNQNAETYLQAVQCDTMDKSRCVVVELVLGGFALLHQ
jgi:hypothetical protein